MPSIVIAPSTVPAFRPLYRQIQDLIVQALADREWQPGEMIPSELELAARFEVSQGTVRRAIDELAAENLLVRRQGKGTFVATHAEQQIQYRFLRLMPDDGNYRGMARRLLDCRRTRAPADVARMLACKSGDAVVQLRRLLLAPTDGPQGGAARRPSPEGSPPPWGGPAADGKPVVLDEIYLPGEVFEGLTLDTLKEWKGSLYSFFETRFGVRMLRAEEHIRAVAADRMAAETLGVKEGTPLLSVERVTYTYNDRPVEWRRGRYLTTQYHYHNELT